MTAIDSPARLGVDLPEGTVPGAARLRRLPRLAQTGLRVAPGTEAERAVAAALGAALPGPTHLVALEGELVLWLGPDEWLLVGPSGTGPATASVLDQAVGPDGLAVDLSSSRTTFELTGAGARDVVATCCPLDLHPRAFGQDRVAGTLVGGIPAVVHHAEAGKALWIHVPTSYADYVGDWLTPS